MKIKEIFIGFFIVFILFGCGKGIISDIQFTPAKDTHDLVVEGGITTFQITQYIRLSKPAILPNGSMQPISGANMRVNDGTTDIAFIETSTPGLYTAQVNNNANFGQAYTLKINHNNKNYTAVDTLSMVQPIEDSYLPFSTTKLDNGNVLLTIPKHTFGAANTQMWLITYHNTPVWKPSNLNEQYPYSYVHNFGSPNALYPLTQNDRHVELSLKDTVTVYKFSLSNTRSQYLYNLFQETDWKGIFSSVPGKITGNVSNGANGYFYATDIQIEKYLVKNLTH